MSQALSPLERLGLEVVAFTLLGSRMESALLCALLDAHGRVASYETLGKARKWRMVEGDMPSRNAIKVRVCLLRNKLEDVGLGANLVRNHENHGYSLPEPGRSLILERLIAEAS